MWTGRVHDSRFPVHAHRREAGFTYIAMLLAVAVIGVGLSATGEIWSHSSQREKEKHLLFIGNQFRQAIERYYRRTPDQRTCPAKCYPQKLEDLLQDKRYPGTQRYLRKIYADPMTGKAEWGLVKAPDGGITGVYSLSGLTPIKTSGFRERDRSFEGANHFSDWKFMPDESSLQGPSMQQRQKAGTKPATTLAVPGPTPMGLGVPPTPPSGRSLSPQKKTP